MIDLHVHSTISDGMDSPKQIIRKAKQLGLTTVALTDHDCIDGLIEAEKEAHKLGINFIKGIELSVSYGEGRIIHILGLGINPEDPTFKQHYTAFRQRRNHYVKNTLASLNKQGIFPETKELLEISTDAYLDRQTVAKWLLKTGYTTSMQESWVNYIDKIPYAEDELIDMVSALNMIRSAGGKSFMAHFHKPIGLFGYSEEECHNILTELKTLGLNGLEGYYPDFTSEHHKILDGYIKKYGFIASGGSDYHGSNRPSVKLGKGNGSLHVPDSLIEEIFGFDLYDENTSEEDKVS